MVATNHRAPGLSQCAWSWASRYSDPIPEANEPSASHGRSRFMPEETRIPCLFFRAQYKH